MPDFSPDLIPNAANFVPLSPLSFLKRAARVSPDATAIVYGDRIDTYATFLTRARRLASALAARGIAKGDCVSILAANTPEMLESHFGVPMTGAVLNSLNIRLDPQTIAFILQHSGARVLIFDGMFAPTIHPIKRQLKRDLLLVPINDPAAPANDDLGDITYEQLLSDGDAHYDSSQPDDEWQALSLLYTSGTTGNPKGCVYHHRGSYLNALGNLNAVPLDRHSRYLWTLPMFHCDGWSFIWSVTAAMATHVCLRALDPRTVYELIHRHRVTHLCGAPIVMNMLATAPSKDKTRFDHRVEVITGGAAPPSAVIQAMEADGFAVTHAYGLTETYGPASFCLPQAQWSELPDAERHRQMARQGIPYLTLEALAVKDPESLEDVPADGKSIGEVMTKGNTIMRGYLNNDAATRDAFAGGWFHTGDLAVVHPDGYIEIKDRSKDIIISGGENISSLEVEEVLFRHPKILEAAVVAQPDEIWGESPCAFVALANDCAATEAEIVGYCRNNLAHFKVPKRVIFGELPKTATGKIQKFQLRQLAARPR